MRDVIIIGGGPAGYTAAIYASRAGHYPLVFEGDLAGGQLTMTTDVENFPGFAEGVQGPELMEAMRRQAERLGAKLVTEKVTVVDFLSRPFQVTAGERTEEAQAVIVATGGSPRRLGLDAESALYGKGVSTCATCDGFFYKNKVVGVVGGGDAAVTEADFLTRFADKVYILHRRDRLRASKAVADKARANPKIEFVWNVVVDEILDVEAGHVTGVRLKDVVNGETRQLELDGLFVLIGHDPNSDLFKGQLELDESGHVLLKEGAMTSVPGVFAAGDISDRRYRQAVTAAGSGCQAALDAQRFLDENPVA